jgi:hypothetical protein
VGLSITNPNAVRERLFPDSREWRDSDSESLTHVWDSAMSLQWVCILNLECMHVSVRVYGVYECVQAYRKDGENFLYKFEYEFISDEGVYACV